MENKTYKKIEDVDEDDLIDYRPVKIKSYNYLRKRTKPISDKIIKLKIKKLIKDEINCDKLKLIYNSIRKIMNNNIDNKLIIEKDLDKINNKLEIEQARLNNLTKDTEFIRSIISKVNQKYCNQIDCDNHGDEQKIQPENTNRIN
jgi:hypothetical protein